MSLAGPSYDVKADFRITDGFRRIHARQNPTGSVGSDALWPIGLAGGAQAGAFEPRASSVPSSAPRRCPAPMPRRRSISPVPMRPEQAGPPELEPRTAHQSDWQMLRPEARKRPLRSSCLRRAASTNERRPQGRRRPQGSLRLQPGQIFDADAIWIPPEGGQCRVELSKMTRSRTVKMHSVRLTGWSMSLYWCARGNSEHGRWRFEEKSPRVERDDFAFESSSRSNLFVDQLNSSLPRADRCGLDVHTGQVPKGQYRLPDAGEEAAQIVKTGAMV